MAEDIRFFVRPITKEALMRCVEQEIKDKDLVSKIERDNSFDVVLVYSPNADMKNMRVELTKSDIRVPVYDAYCGHALHLTLKKLPYSYPYEFTSVVRLKRK